MVLAVFRRQERFERLIAWLHFCVFYETQNSKNKNRIRIYSLLTYDRQFRSPISLEAHLLTFTYDYIYDTCIL